MRKINSVLSLVLFLSLMTSSLQISISQTFPKKTQPVAIADLTDKYLPVPEDFSVVSAKFFKYSIKNVSQVELEFRDINKSQLMSVYINDNPVNKTVEYKIKTSDGQIEWIRVNRTTANGKDVTKTVSSSGKTLRVITSTNDTHREC